MQTQSVNVRDVQEPGPATAVGPRAAGRAGARDRTPEVVAFVAAFGLALACRALGFGDGALLAATPASGVVLFATVVRRGPGAAAAAAGLALAALVAGESMGVALLDAGAQVLAALVAAAAMRGLARRRAARNRVSDWLILLVGVCVFAATVAATFLAAGLAGAPVASVAPGRAALLALAFAPLGLLTGGAAIASLGEIGRVRSDPRPAYWTAALGLAALTAFWLLLDGRFVGPNPSGLVVVLALPFCLWIAMQRRSLDGAALSFVAALSALVMLRGRVEAIEEAEFVTSVIFLSVLVATCQLVHAVNRDRLAALDEVEAQRRELEARVEERTARLAAMTERAVAADAAKTRFLATVSHEVRTPLNGVLGMASVVLADPDLDPQVRRSVETIRTSGVHLLDVITRLLDFTRLESRRAEPEREPFDLAEVVEEVLTEARFLPYAAGLSLRVELESGLARMRLGHRSGLRQILTNLVGNAAKFTDEGGVTVRARALAGGALRIEVRDTGVGVPPAERERIFLPYEQLACGHRPDGSGLGLAICAEAVRRMGGRIGVDGAAGGGSLFWIEAPMPVAVLGAGVGAGSRWQA